MSGCARRLALALLMSFTLLSTGAALARPGGGQHYSAPSRSYSPPRSSYSSSHSGSWGGTGYSGSSSSSSSSGGDDVSSGTVVLILLVIIVIYVIYQRLKKNAQQRASVAVGDEARNAGLAALKAEDPAFDEAAFASACRKMMTIINSAWVAGKMGPARRFLSDGVYVRFQAQLALLAKQGIKNVMVDAVALSAEVAAAESDHLWDTVHVKVTGQARDADVPVTLSAADAERKAKSAPLRQYEEVWSFLRRRGRKSKAGVPALDGNCANCGNELPMGDVVRCDVCKALTNSGEHDWVLAEITQPEEWSPGGAAMDAGGLDRLRQRDPSVSRQELEDRASVAFWKWLEARVLGDRKRLERFCVTKGQPDAPPRDLRQAAVGAAELQSIVLDAGSGRDRANVEIRWSAADGGGEPTSRTSVVVLARSSQAVSKRGLSCLDCPSCGGPVTDSDAVTCEYCKEPLGGGDKDWALVSIEGDL